MGELPPALPAVAQALSAAGAMGKMQPSGAGPTRRAALHANGDAIMPDIGKHDLAGKPAGPIDRKPHPASDFDERMDALMMYLSHPRTNLIVVDELRRAVEGLDEEKYFGLSYYERWVHAARRLLVEKGVLTEQEIDARVAQVREQLRRSGHA